VMATTLASPHDLQANGRSHATRGRGCLPVIAKSPDRLGGGFAWAIAPVILAAVMTQPGTRVREASRSNNRSHGRLHGQDIAGTPDGTDDPTQPHFPLINQIMHGFL